MRSPNRARRAAFTLAGLILAAVTVELLSVAVHGLVFGGLFSYAAAAEARAALSGAPGEAPPVDQPRKVQDENNVQALHPFVGYVLDPAHSPVWPVNEFGFLGDPPPIGRPAIAGAAVADPQVSIAILGGSVAENVCIWGDEALRRELATIPGWQGRDVAISCLALRGLKQPQQLMVLSWFLFLGARFDVVINLDGFNEIVLSGENALQGTFPFYPRRWKTRLEGLPNETLRREAGRVAWLQDWRVEIAGGLGDSPLRWSATANVGWELFDRWLARRIEKARGTLNRELLAAAGGEGYESRGPELRFASDDERFAVLAEHWKRASLILDRTARANGIRYLHFLQPNQWVEGSKPFHPEEEALARPESYFFRGHASGGYPYLIEAGRELGAQGVAFHDLTMLFREHHEPLYSDPCCHLNQRGYELVAAEIGRSVARAIADDGLD